jgi:hypothetical protein
MGRGHFSSREAGQVAYEIDGYLDGGARSAHGQIEAARHVLEHASQAVDATLVLDSGRCIHVVVSDPHGGAAEVRVAGAFPL